MPRPCNAQPLDAGDWFPWRLFVEVAAAACSPRVLLLAVAGLLLAEPAAGWFGASALPVPVDDLSLSPIALGAGSAEGLSGYCQGFLRPFTSATGGWLDWLAALWPVLVWTAVGPAIARSVVMTLTRHDPITASDAASWSVKTAGARIGLIAALLIVLGLMHGSVRLLGALSDTSVIGGLAVPGVFGVAAMTAVAAIAVAIGWPLMTAAAGVERPDPFDTMSRGLAYAYQRPLRLATYATLAWVVGAAAGAVVQLLVRLMLRIAAGGLATAPEELTGAAAFWWAEAARLPHVYHAAYFWSATTAIYLLLRRDIDEQQADEVFLEQDTAADQPTTHVSSESA